MRLRNWIQSAQKFRPFHGRRRRSRPLHRPLAARFELLENRTLLSAGTLDPAFGNGGVVLTDIVGNALDAGRAMAIQSDGKMVVVGSHDAASGTNFAIARYNTDGSLDTGFGVDGRVIPDTPLLTSAWGVAIDSSGRIVAVGSGANAGQFGIARYTRDGTLDTTFGGDGIVGTQGLGTARDVVIQPDGKIVVGGGNSDFNVARYNEDGSLDTSFDDDGISTIDLGTTNDQLYGLALQPTGKIVAAGSRPGNGSEAVVVRLADDGSLDKSFDGDGILTTNFGVLSAFARDVAVDADGKIVIAGGARLDGFSHAGFLVARFNSDGTLDDGGSSDSTPDDSLGAEGFVHRRILTTGTEQIAWGVAIDGDGKIVAAGGVPSDFAMLRLNPDGSFDTDFDGDGALTTNFGLPSEARAVAVHDGKIIAAGGTGRAFRAGDFALARYNSDGSLDSTLDDDGRVITDLPDSLHNFGQDVAIQPDGKIVVAGISGLHILGSQGDIAVARYHPDGTLDVSFGDRGIVLTDFNGAADVAHAVGVDSRGRIVVGGATNGGPFALVRYNPDGSLDTTFGDGGKVVYPVSAGPGINDLLIQPDDKIVALGHSIFGGGRRDDFVVIRVNTDGSLDSDFGGAGAVAIDFGDPAGVQRNDFGRGIAYAGGKIVVTGRSATATNQNDFAIAVLNANGSLDSTFGVGGKVVTDFGFNDIAESLAVDSDGRFVVAGHANTDIALARYRADGTLDPSFGSSGLALIDLGSNNDRAFDVAIQASGRIVAVGQASGRFAVTRYNVDGTLDSGFGSGGVVVTAIIAPSTADAVAIDADGKIVAAGYARDASSVTGYEFAVARYEGEAIVSPLLVTNTNDSGPGSLRHAIEFANSNPGPDTIAFNIPATDPNYEDADSALIGGDADPDVFVIRPVSPLPALDDVTGGTTIDGRTQAGFGSDTNPFGPEIVLDGSQAGSGTHGLTVSSGGNLVVGLNLQQFGGSGIWIGGSYAVDNRIAGNYVGTDPTGTDARPNTYGIVLHPGASYNWIGTDGNGADDDVEGNLISGNAEQGVLINAWKEGVPVEHNVVAGNRIGTDAAGTGALGNGTIGVQVLFADARFNRIGTDADGTSDTLERNVISGNLSDGIRIDGGASQNVVAGNYVGTDIEGSVLLGNGGDGVLIASGADSNRIGTNGDGTHDAAERNVISGNARAGVFISNSSENVVAGNYIGTDADGANAVPNTTAHSFWGGVVVQGGNALNNRIGTDGSDDAYNENERNLISGNASHGMRLHGARQTIVSGNYIGLARDGLAALGNSRNGIAISYATANRIGADGSSDAYEEIRRNVISGNGTAGVTIQAGSESNVVAGNYIGTDANGSVARPNTYGVYVFTAGNTIGGTSRGSGNLISGNLESGITLEGHGATENLVQGNFIGTDAAGTAALGNGGSGIWIRLGAANNLIGTDGDGVAGAAEANTIAFNGAAGVRVTEEGSTGNTLRRNSIHSNGGLGIDLGGDGITRNDVGDADLGPNQLQNFPGIGLVETDSTTGATRVAGTLHSLPATTFMLDFYANSSLDPTLSGEGQRWLGAAQVTADANGDIIFEVTLSAPISADEFVTATATDPNGNTSEFSGRLPTAEAGGPYTVAEGGAVVLSTTGMTDPDQDSSTLTYVWDLDGDGIFGETGTAASRGDEVGASPTFSAADLDGPSQVAVTLRVTDNTGLFDLDTAHVEITNVAPSQVVVSGPASAVPGQPLSFAGSFFDPGSTDTHSFAWQVIDPDGQVVASGDDQQLQFVPTKIGSYNVALTVTDDDGGAGSGQSTLAVSTIQSEGDACTGGTVLRVGGSLFDDHIAVNPGDTAGQVEVQIDGTLYGSFAADRLEVYGQDGNDVIQVAGSIMLPAWLFGGHGDDKIKGGGGHDVIVGGPGDDLLVGKAGRDLLIGGLGADRIVGNSDDDILIAGGTVHSDRIDRNTIDYAALCAIMALWTDASTAQTAQDRANILGGDGGLLDVSGDNAKVFADIAADVLTGSAGDDWFLFNEEDGNDRATDLEDVVFAQDLDWILE